MKKLFVLLAMVAFVVSFASCAKVCECKESKSGYTFSEPIKVLGVKVYKNCKALQDERNSIDPDGDWTCK